MQVTIFVSVGAKKKKAAEKESKNARSSGRVVFGYLESSDFRVFGFDQTKPSFVFVAHSCLPLITFVAAFLCFFLFLLFLPLSCPLFWGHMATPTATATPATRLAQKTRRACYVIGNERRRYVLSFCRFFFGYPIQWVVLFTVQVGHK